MSLKIAVISDLHCRDSKEDRKTTYLYTDLLPNPVTSHPIEAFKERVKDDELSCDYLICLGDITDKISQQGLLSGSNYIKEIGQSLGVSQDKIIILAGNHDVDSRKTHNGHPSFAHIVKSLNDTIPISDKVLGSSFWSDKYFIKEYEDLVLLAYNSVYNHYDIEQAQKTDIDDITLGKMRSDLEKFKNSPKTKIAISHHHPMMFSNFDLEYEDKDYIKNGDKFLQLLQEFNVGLYIHGHKHLPRLAYNDRLPVFCSGTFASLENIREIGIKNMFHIVEFSDLVKGTIETYEFVLGKGWKKSQDPENYFPPNSGFGYFGDIKLLSERIVQWVNDSGRQLISYGQIIEDFSEISFLSPSQLNELEENLRISKIIVAPSLKVRVKEQYIIKGR